MFIVTEIDHFQGGGINVMLPAKMKNKQSGSSGSRGSSSNSVQQKKQNHARPSPIDDGVSSNESPLKPMIATASPSTTFSSAEASLSPAGAQDKKRKINDPLPACAFVVGIKSN